MCKGKGKFGVFKDKTAKCFRSTCVLNKTQDIFSLLINLGKAADFKEALHIASKYGNVDLATEHIKQYRTRSQCLHTVYKLYRDQLHKTEYLATRGLLRSPFKVKVGFSPPISRFLVNSSLPFSASTLFEQGLIDEHEDDTMFNRIVFPICSIDNEYVHLQGRSLDPHSNLRWKCTSTLKGEIKSNMEYTYNIEQCKKEEVIFLTEGVTDGLSLIEIGLPTVSCFGLKPALINEVDEMKNLKDIVAIFDNDRHELNKNNTEHKYKSWPQVLPYLVELKLFRPHLNIWCVAPPGDSNIKDINEWLLKGLTLPIFEEYCKENMVSLWSWYIHVMGIHGSHVLDLLPFITHTERSLFKDKVSLLYSDWIDYITAF
jgi:hypothetical protein